MSEDDAASSDAEQIEDEAEEDDVVPHVSYDVTSYGSDPDVDGLVRKLKRGDIIIPPFQRDYVWRQPEASRFIESLLLGLPVPGVFLATEPATNKQLVIDGQQRLKSLLFFMKGISILARATKNAACLLYSRCRSNSRVKHMISLMNEIECD